MFSENQNGVDYPLIKNSLLQAEVSLQKGVSKMVKLSWIIKIVPIRHISHARNHMSSYASFEGSSTSLHHRTITATSYSGCGCSGFERAQVDDQ